METFVPKLCLKLQADLQKLKNENLSMLNLCEQSVRITFKTLQQLRPWINDKPFTNPTAEIHFFKAVKPKFLSQLIYYVEMYQLHTSLPAWCQNEMRNYLMNKIEKINNYRRDNLAFYQYMQNDLTTFDELYFLRHQICLTEIPDAFFYDSDPNFTTMMDYKVARFLADEMLLVYINQKLDSLSINQENATLSSGFSSSSFCWTESKIALVELIYALHSAGCINNGNVGIKDIARYFQEAFHIDLGDFYNDFKQIKTRSNQTKFIDQLKSSINLRILKQDES